MSDMNGPFGANARRYWDLGLNVIPLVGKRPAPLVLGWQAYSTRRVREDELDGWLGAYGGEGTNIGLVLGPASGFVAMDVDTDDPTILSAFDRVLPNSPWVRRGRKGYVVLFKYSGQSTFRVRREGHGGASGESICDFLSVGSQVVIPPSIHPDTGRVYTANCELGSQAILDQIGFLPPNFEEILKDSLRQAGVKTAARGKVIMSSWVPAGGRDNELVRRAGLLSYDVLRGNMTFVRAAETIEAWQTTLVEKVWGDDLPAGKGTQKLVECMRKDIFGPRKRTLPTGWSEGLEKADLKALGLDDLGDDNRRFDYEEILAIFTEKMEAGGVKRDGPSMMAAVETVAARVAGNGDITKLQEDQLLRFVSQATGGAVSIAAIRRRVADLRAGEIKGTDHSELAKAVLEQVSRVGEVRYHEETLWQWQGSHWDRMNETGVLALIAGEYGEYPAARKAPDHQGILKTLRVLCGGVLKKSSVRGINFVNGYLTEDLVLMPHDPDFGCNYVLDYPYRPDLAGKCTLWMQMLTNYWSKDDDFAEKIEALQQAMAATLFGVSADYQRAICLFGVAFSGKSRVIEIMKGLMPEGCGSVIPPAKWAGTFDLAEMAGKLMNVAGELSEKTRIPGEVFKLVVDGSELPAQFKHKPLFKFRARAAQWFASNHPPQSDDSSEGFTRRWLFLEFNRVLPASERILGFDQVILQEEKEAVAAWAVQGLTALKAQREFTLPPSHVKITELVANATNSVRFFLASLQRQGKILLGAGSHEGKLITGISTERLFSEYRQFCVSQASVSPANFHGFLARMKELQGRYGFRVAETVKATGVAVNSFELLTLVERRVA